MRVLIRPLLMTFVLAVLLQPAQADTKKQEEEKKKLEAEKKKFEAEEKKKREAEKKAEAEKYKHSTFHGMIMTTSSDGGKNTLIIKHANGGWQYLSVDRKTQITGLGIKSFDKVKKGQIVTAHFSGKPSSIEHPSSKHLHATKLEISKQAEKTPELVGKKESHHGTVVKIESDQYGDNGRIWIKDAKGKTREFNVHNETIIDSESIRAAKKGGTPSPVNLQSVQKMKDEKNLLKVKIAAFGKEAVHIDMITKK